ncbi:MAG: ATP-binding cassette domain-containing protein [Nitriliruptorales bacterium]
MIRLRDVTKVFPGSSEPAVGGLSFDVPEGEIAVLVGPSGCGKTTTLRMINRLIEPTSGTIEVGGERADALPEHELRRRIGYVIQSVGLFPHRTIAQNIATVPRLLGWDRQRITARVDELVEIMGLDPQLRRRYPSELSGGQQQRVGVARALAADPPVLLMDEPFGAVDPIVRTRLQHELLALQERVKKTIVFVTHDIDEAILLGDRVAILNIGGVLEQYAPPEEILREPTGPFVEDFLGSERGLKRLSLIPVTSLELQRGPVVDASASIEEAKQVVAAEDVDWVGVLDGRRLRGWVWISDLEPGRAVGDHETRQFRVWIEAGSSLRTALDAIVNTRNNVAVVYDGDHYLGMLTIDRISRELIG